MPADTAPAFGPPLIGQTEKALNTILVRELEGSGLSASDWVLLKRLGGAEGVGPEDSRAIDALVEAGFLDRSGTGIAVTTKAREFQARIGARIGEITARLWGDLPEADLATAGRVLETALSRANAELGYSI
jgi:hypothetical protein